MNIVLHLLWYQSEFALMNHSVNGMGTADHISVMVFHVICHSIEIMKMAVRSGQSTACDDQSGMIPLTLFKIGEDRSGTRIGTQMGT
jgi:hypothetical protein